MHRLLNKLYRFDDKIKAHKGKPEIATLEDIGLRLLRPLETWDYEFTPLNCSTFATTGGDGVHFSFLHLAGKVTEESPIIMTVPMMPDEPNRIVGTDLHEFLSLGCVVGYDVLEGLVYAFDETVRYLFHYEKFVARSFAGEPAPEDLQDLATQRRLIELLSKELDLALWPNLKKRLRELNKQWLGTLELRPQESDGEDQEKPEVVALMKAAEKGEVAVVRNLLQQGVDMNTHDRCGRTALFFAATYGQKNIVQVLLAHGADVNIPEEGGEILPGSTPLMAAAGHGHVAIVQALLDKGAEVEAKNQYGGTALSSAAAEGQVAVVRVLLTKGANVNCKDRWGQTPLMWAVQGGQSTGHLLVVKLLLEHGASVTEKAVGGETVLTTAVVSTRVDMVKFLLAHGAAAPPRALKLAAAGGHPEYANVLQVLLEHGVRVNARDSEGLTPLMWAAMTGHADSVKILLAHGANMTARAPDGKTALDHATTRRRISVIQVLKQAGAKA